MRDHITIDMVFFYLRTGLDLKANYGIKVTVDGTVPGSGMFANVRAIQNMDGNELIVNGGTYMG